MMADDQFISSPNRHKRRPSLCLSCCFGNNNNHHHEILQSSSSPKSDDLKSPSLIRSPTSWIKSRVHQQNHHHHEFPEFKEKCRNLFCKIGKGRRHSADFRYDPLSYALNFDEGSDETLANEFPSRNFSARLPLSPQAQSPRKQRVPSSILGPRDIAAYS